MRFKVSLLDFEGNTDWIEPVLFEIREMLDALTCPDHEFACPYGEYLDKSFAVRVDA